MNITPPTISSVFDLLNRWRHLPFYSLETRAAPFFAVFMRDVLDAHFKDREFHETLIPEFPLRIGTLYTDDEREKKLSKNGRKPSADQSCNVDYVAFDKDGKTAYLVELKTDLDSTRPDQNVYLERARKKEFSCLVEGVRKLAQKSKKKQKYVHLLHRLAATGLALVDMPEELYCKTFPRMLPGWTKALGEQEPRPGAFSTVEVVFVQPTEHPKSEYPDFKYIYFDEVADIIQTGGDLGCVFANYLRQWTEPAGSCDPRTWA